MPVTNSVKANGQYMCTLPRSMIYQSGLYKLLSTIEVAQKRLTFKENRSLPF